MASDKTNSGRPSDVIGTTGLSGNVHAKVPDRFDSVWLSAHDERLNQEPGLLGLRRRFVAVDALPIYSILASLDNLRGYRVNGQAEFLAHVDSLRAQVLALTGRPTDA